jgi:acyl-CoA synthetase (NDP forming)
MTHPDLVPLLQPKSVAVIGASNDITKIGGRVLSSFLTFGFTGKLYPIHLKADEILGLRAYPSVLDVPDDIDLALVTIPAAATEAAMKQCAQKKVKFVVVHGTGFSEYDELGKEREERILEIAREGGLRIVGPNCMGLFCPKVKLNTIVSRDAVPFEPGPVGFSGQSGWVSENTVLWGSERGLRFSGVISSGNQVDLNLLDYINYFGQDPETRVIGLYQEGIRNSKDFIRVARDTSRKKPIVMWKSGSSEAGARAVASHTASLAGSSRITDAVLRQTGVLKATNLEELHDFLIAFCAPNLPKGKQIGILVESGGGGVSAADTCDELGLKVPPIPAEIRQELIEFTSGKIPPTSGMSNPVDIAWAPAQGTREFWLGCVEILSKAADALIVITYQSLTDDDFIHGILDLMNRTEKLIVLIPGHSTTQTEGMTKCVCKGIPVFPTPERAVKAVHAMTEYVDFINGSPLVNR